MASSQRLKRLSSFRIIRHFNPSRVEDNYIFARRATIYPQLSSQREPIAEFILAFPIPYVLMLDNIESLGKKQASHLATDLVKGILEIAEPYRQKVDFDLCWPKSASRLKELARESILRLLASSPSAVCQLSQLQRSRIPAY